MSQQHLSWLKTTGGLALMFAITAYQCDLRTATVLVSACLAGWLNVFGVFHALISIVRREAISEGTWLAVVIALAFSALLVFFGYWLVLAFTSACLLVIDAIVLRFAGPPIGYKVTASEP